MSALDFLRDCRAGPAGSPPEPDPDPASLARTVVSEPTRSDGCVAARHPHPDEPLSSDRRRVISPSIARMTAADDSVDTPRVRGK